MTRSVAEITRRDFLTLTLRTPIRRAVALLVQARATAALVLDDSGALQGILTQKDCFRPTLQASYYQEWTGTVADYMSAEVVSLPAEADLMDAAEAFLTRSHRVFPVLNGEKLVGILHRSDVLAALVRLG